MPHAQRRQPLPGALAVPRGQCRQHPARAGQRVGGVARAHVGDAEGRQQRVADELLQAAAVAEDLLLHAAVEGAQHRHHLFRRHVLGQRGEADQVGEQHADGLAAHATQRLVALGQRRPRPWARSSGRGSTRSRSASARSATRMRERRTSSASPAPTTTGTRCTSFSNFSIETKFGSRYVASRPLGRSGPVTESVTVPGRVTTHRNASVHAPAPHSPVHSKQPRPEGERHLHQQDEEEQEARVAQRHRRRQRTVANGLGAMRTAASSQRSTSVNR